MWKPIETAPKDGTPILGYADGEMTTVQWIVPEMYPDNGYWGLVICGSHPEDGEWNPTHWDDLPDSPESEQGRADGRKVSEVTSPLAKMGWQLNKLRAALSGKEKASSLDQKYEKDAGIRTQCAVGQNQKGF